jgi:hypothetical protein
MKAVQPQGVAVAVADDARAPFLVEVVVEEEATTEVVEATIVTRRKLIMMKENQNKYRSSNFQSNINQKVPPNRAIGMTAKATTQMAMPTPAAAKTSQMGMEIKTTMDSTFPIQNIGHFRTV